MHKECISTDKLLAARLKRNFFEKETTYVAEALLSQVLVRVLKNGTRLSGRIIETEAYLGVRDPSCHSFGGRQTQRNKTMYWPGGFSYVYFTYGMHYCFNIVTAKGGEPEAVLIRALEPLEGVDIMRKNRKGRSDLTGGPAKLCQALEITKTLNGENLEGKEIFIEKRKRAAGSKVIIGPRIGLSPSSPASLWPLRFSLALQKTF